MCFLIGSINETLKENVGGNSKDTKNQYAAIRLVNMAQIHSGLFYLINFREAIDSYTGCPTIKEILINLCLLFGINQILGKAAVLVQISTVSPNVFGSLELCKERLLKQLRPDLIAIIDGIALPDYAIRSEIISGDNIY
jgi:hypothetical protein